jgi:hypothetical protein
LASSIPSLGTVFWWFCGVVGSVPVQVSHFRRGRKLKTIHTDLQPGYSREAPNWMFDQSFCAGMTEGPPEISIEGLNELAKLLASFGKPRKRRGLSFSSNPKERRRAEKKMWRSSAAQARSEQTSAAIPAGEEHEGPGGGPCRHPPGSDGTSIAEEPKGHGRLG